MFKRSYNSDHVKQDNGSIKATFRQGWLNYLDANEKWQSIDTKFVDAGEYFEVSKAPFILRAPKNSNGSATFISNNRYDVFNKTTIKDDPFNMSIRPLGIAQVQGVIETGDLGFGKTNYVIYKKAYPQLDADLIYYVQHGRAPRLRKLVRFNSKPNAQVLLKFDLIFDEKPYIKCEDGLWNEKEILKPQGCVSFRKSPNNSPRGVGLYDFFLWDEWDNRKKINVELNKIGQNQTRLTKIISASEFEDLTFPCYTDASASFNPDVDPETSSVDGYMTREAANQTWSAIRSGAGTASNDSSSSLYMILQVDKNNNEFGLMRRIKLVFDTSSIGAGYYVDSAILKYTPSVILFNDFSSSMTICSATTASDTSLAATDYNIASFGSTRLASDVLISSMTADVEVSVTLNASGINNIDLEDKSRFGLILDHDFDDSPPAWSANASTDLRFYSSDNGTFEPTLDVTYFEETNNINLPLLGVG